MASYDNKGQPSFVPPPYSPPSQPGYAPPPSTHAGYGPPPPSQPGWNPPSAPGYGTTGGAVVIQQPAQTVVVLGGCPTCRVGHLEDEFTCCGILCCILFFPLGLICLFTMRDKRCTNCGATF